MKLIRGNCCRHSLRVLAFIAAVVFIVWILVETEFIVFSEFEAREVVRKYLENRADDFRAWLPWDNYTGFPKPIVPNIVHFIRFRKHELSFVDMVVILAAWCNQKPERIIIHCDCDEMRGRYWEKVKRLPGLEVRRIEEPTEIFGRTLSKLFRVYHAGDVARIAVLQEFGGIALDFDTYIVKSLDEFRRFECTVAWPPDANFGCQIILAHKRSRFIHLYHESYRFYKPSIWYYNAGQLPTRIMELLPNLVHRVPLKFGVHDLTDEIYKSQWEDWQSYYSVHLLEHHVDDRKYSRVKEFDEYNIRTFPFTLGEMARKVVFGSKYMVTDNRAIDWNFPHCKNNRSSNS